MTAVSEPIYHTELIDGHEIEKPLPNKLHALIQRYLMLLLNRDLHSGLLALSELNVLPGQMAPDGRQGCLVPAIVVTTRAARYEDGALAEPPLWAVEILSSGQTISDLFARAQRLLNLGCPLV